ncbi:MAG: M28 family peptidase [Muribaculaceae bacterium]|nr:M28 family peptidase [Muribaculaceae bacterium]
MIIKNIIYTLLTLTALTACSSGTSSSASSATNHADNPGDYAKVSFSADSAMAYLTLQTQAGPRVPGTQPHKLTAERLEQHMRHYAPDTVIAQKTTMAMPPDGHPAPITNIFAQWNASNPARILLLAHWDTRPWADQDPDPANHDKPIDGANDGASGVAVLMEIARLLSTRAPGIGVDILLVDAEDSGTADDDNSWCLGTQHFVKNLPYANGVKPRYAILLDMVGGRDAQFHREYFSDYYAPDIVDHVWAVARKSGFSQRFPNTPGNAITDDHRILNQAGIPAIDIIESKNPQTGSFNPTWHTLSDTAENIDPETIRIVGQTIANLIYNE